MGTHPIFESDFDCLTDVEMSKSIKNILTEFESYNHSSIQPLPPIQTQEIDESKIIWPIKNSSVTRPPNLHLKSSIEVDDEIRKITERDYDIEFSKEKVKSEKTPFRPYIRSEVPLVSSCPLSDPALALSKKDARKVQVEIHQSVIKDSFQRENVLKNQKDDDQLSIVYSEIERYPQHKSLLLKIMSQYENYLSHLQSNSLPEEKIPDEVQDNTIVEALKTLEIEKSKAIEKVKETEKLEKFVPEPIRKVVHEEIDPVYGKQTISIRDKAIFLQKQMDEAEKLTREISEFRKWNPLLEQDLLLDEKDLRSEIRQVRQVCENYSKRSELREIHSDVQKLFS